MTSRSFLLLAAASAISLGIVLQSAAQPTTYSRSRNPIRCGMLLLASTADLGRNPDPYVTARNYDPYVFYNLGKRMDLVPSGWDFVNPFAPAVVTGRIAQRWGLKIGDPIQKNMAAYWEVFLPELTDKMLGSYNVFVIHAGGTISLTPREREKLRRFIDGGGVVWLDKTSDNVMDDANPLVLSFGFGGGSPPGVINPLHPLLNFPHKLTYSEAALLGTQAGSAPGMVAGTYPSDIIRFAPVTANSTGPVIADADFGSGHLVVTTSNIVSMLNEPAGGTTTPNGRNSGPYGGTNFLNIPVPALKFAYNVMGLMGVHKQFGKDARKTNATFEDIHAPLFPKWAAIGAQYTPQSDSSDHHGSTYHPPALFKGLVIVSTGTHILAFDADPSKDLDGDGNPDDGIPDYTLPGYGPGYTADLIWSWPPPGQSLPANQLPLSSPLCVEIPTVNTATNQPVPLNQVWVLAADGTVYLLDAFPYDQNAHKFIPYPPYMVKVAPPVVFPGADKVFVPDILEDGRSVPNALTYADGMIFASAGWLPKEVTDAGTPAGGICWVISATAAKPIREDPGQLGWFVARGGRPSQAGNTNNLGQVKAFNTSPCVANVPMSDDGVGSDQVVYLGTSRSSVNQSANTNASPGFAALWFRAHGEKLVYESQKDNSTAAIFRTRASQQNQAIFDSHYQANGPEFRELDVRIYATRVDANGNEIPVPVSGGADPDHKGKILVDAMDSVRASTVSVYADYTVDWVVPNDASGNIDILARTKIQFSDQNPPYSDVVKSLAVAPNGNVFVVTSERDVDGSRTAKPPYGAGSLYCFKERMGSVKLVYRWVLHNGYNQFMSQSSTDSQGTWVPPAIVDADDLVTKLVPFLNQPLFKLHFHGSPTIYNNMVYLVASGRKKVFGFEAPVTIILAFDADPAPAEIRLNGPITTDPGQITLQQPDITAETTDRLNPRQAWCTLSNQNLQQMDVDLEQGIIHINNFLVPAGRAMMSVRSISTSQPVLVKLASSQTPIFINPNATGSHWSPLRWYIAMNGFGNQSPVMVTGGTLYIAGSSVLGSFMNGNGGPMLPQSVVFAWDSDVPVNDEFMINDPVTPTNTISNHQLMWLKVLPTFKGDPHLRWPSFEGLTGMDTWRSQYATRLKQATLSGAQTALGAIGGEGLLVAWDPTGLYAFDRALTLVTDQGRAIEVDAEGFADWSTQSTFNGVPDPITGIDLKVAQIAAPTKAYKLSSNEYLIVDTSANRVVRMDRAGFEMRSITGFSVAKMTQSGGNSLLGFTPGDPTTLNQPRDAMVWSEYILAKDNPFLDPPPAPIEYWTHYLIADTGNARLVDIVDRQQSDTNFAVYGTIATGQLVYHSPLNAFGRRYRYDTVSRIATGLDKNQYPTFAIVSTVSNWELGENSIGSWGGSQNVQAFSGLGNVLIERFDTTLPLAGRLVVVQKATNPVTGAERRLIGPVSAQVYPAGWDTSDPAHPQAILGILIADQQGVIELKQAARGDYKNWLVAWELTNDDYLNLHRQLGDGVQLRAAGARRLPNGDILITNSFVGSTEHGAAFSGEVLEVHESAYQANNPRNHGFTKDAVAAQIPPLTGTSSLRNPLFADRQ